MRSAQATETFRLAQLDDVERSEENARARKWESKKIKQLAAILDLNESQIMCLKIWLPYVDEEYQRTKWIRQISSDLPVCGDVQFSPGQIVALLKVWDKLPKGEIPLGLESRMARLTHDGTISFEQARKLTLKKYQSIKEPGKNKRCGSLAAQYVAALLLRFIQREVPEVTIKCRNLFIHESLKTLAIPHPNLMPPSSRKTSSAFQGFIREAQRFNIAGKTRGLSDEEFEAQFDTLAGIHF